MSNQELHSTENKLEQKAIIVGMFRNQKDEMNIEDSMIELAELVQAAGGEVLAKMIQNKAKIEPATYIGSGKVEEVREMALANEANVVVFNDELSGVQIRNLEDAIGMKVVDRTALILDIFALRAQSKMAKLQVEYAQLKYRGPRLIGYGGQLSRTGGGIGTRGPGEQKLEIDRRRIQERMDEIKKQMNAARRVRDTQRKQREKREVPVVALVGYTNAGKSSIMNRLLKHSQDAQEDKAVFEKDMLFATLDTYNRRIVLEDKKQFILTDTVGFVSKLPHALVDAFKATLEEALDADLLVHVVDAANDQYHIQMTVTDQVLNDLGASQIERLTVYNKIDRCPEERLMVLRDGLHVSAKTGENIESFIEEIVKNIFSSRVKATLLIPYTEGQLLSNLCQKYTVESLTHEEEGTLIDLELEEKDFQKYKAYLR